MGLYNIQTFPSAEKHFKNVVGALWKYVLKICFKKPQTYLPVCFINLLKNMCKMKIKNQFNE